MSLKAFGITEIEIGAYPKNSPSASIGIGSPDGECIWICSLRRPITLGCESSLPVYNRVMLKRSRGIDMFFMQVIARSVASGLACGTNCIPPPEYLQIPACTVINLSFRVSEFV